MKRFSETCVQRIHFGRTTRSRRERAYYASTVDSRSISIKTTQTRYLPFSTARAHRFRACHHCCAEDITIRHEILLFLHVGQEQESALPLSTLFARCAMFQVNRKPERATGGEKQSNTWDSLDKSTSIRLPLSPMSRQSLTNPKNEGYHRRCRKKSTTYEAK